MKEDKITLNSHPYNHGNKVNSIKVDEDINTHNLSEVCNNSQSVTDITDGDITRHCKTCVNETNELYCQQANEMEPQSELIVGRYERVEEKQEQIGRVDDMGQTPKGGAHLNGFIKNNTHNSETLIPTAKEATDQRKLSVLPREIKPMEGKESLARQQSFTLEKEHDPGDSLLPAVEGNGDDRDYSMVPPDGGWGWIVALGGFTIMMLLPTVGSCFGIFFSGFLTERGAYSTTTAWIYNIQMFMWHLLGPLVNPLTTEFGWRKIGFTGVILVSLSMMISAFSPSVGFLFFSFSFISGIGGGLAATMCFMIVPQYFVRRQGLANAVLMTGICMSQITGAPLARYLLDEYGFRGATLIFGAILLNGLVAVSIFHPVQWHMKRVRLTENDCTLKLSSLKPSCEIINDPNETYSASSIRNKNLELSGMKTPSDKSEANSKDQQSVTVTNEVSTNENFVGTLHSIVVRVAKSSASDFKIIKMSRAIIISSGIALSIIGYANFLMVLPFAVRAADFSLEEASNLISLLGISNMITRLTISSLSDLPRFNMRVCIMIGYAIVSICMFVFPFLTTMKWMMVTIVVMGIGIGTNITLNNLVMIKYLGIENLSPTLGVTTLIVGVGAIIFGPFIGFVRDITGSFTISMWIMSSLLAGSFTLWIFMPVAIRWDQAKMKNDQICNIEKPVNSRIYLDETMKISQSLECF